MKFCLKHLSFCGYLLFVSANYCIAQLAVDQSAPHNSTSYLVQDVLMGQGVTAFGFNYTGDPDAIGFFDGTNTNIGLDSGIIMTTGTAKDTLDFGMQLGPFGPNNNGGAGVDNMQPGDVDLTSFMGVDPFTGLQIQSQNAAVLDFFFVPTGDTVQFNYVFASDEYPEYVCSSKNDAFGFFISGPGITGPYSNNAKNIALIPNTTLPVSINAVNPGTPGSSSGGGSCSQANQSLAYSQYYVDNGDGFSGPQMTDPTVVQYDGFTTVLTAIVAVQPCDTYHIKLAIADADDGAFDSGVFLEANSFSSASVSVSAVAPSIGGAAAHDTSLYEGCGPVTLTLVRAGNNSNTDTVNLDITGTATMGTDYTTIPSFVVFTPGNDTVVITFDLNVDGITESVESIIIEAIQDSTFCGPPLSVTGYIALSLSDPIPITLNTVDTTTSCLSDSTTIGVEVLSGLPYYSFLWGTGDTTSTIKVDPIQNTYYPVTVTDVCKADTAVDSVLVSILPGVITLNPQDTSIFCPGDTVLIGVNASGGNMPYQYWWSNGVTADSQYVSVTVDSTFMVTVTDTCGTDTASVGVTVTVIPPPQLIPLAGVDTTVICPGDTVQIDPSATGGAPPYEYSWDGWVSSDSINTVNPLITSPYIVEITDACKTDTVQDTILVIVPVYSPISVVVTSSTDTICPNQPVDFFAVASGGAGTYSYSWSNNGGNDDTTAFTPSVSNTYFVTVTDLCGSNGVGNQHVETIEPMADFTFEFTDGFTVAFTNTSQTAATSFYWDFDDGSLANIENPLHTFVFDRSYNVQFTITDSYNCSDSIIKEVVPPFEVWVPNAFTPNGDLTNDVFNISGIGVKSYEITIFDRFGTIIHESDNFLNNWDGRSKEGNSLPLGVYVYKLKATGYHGEKLSKTGHVTIVR